MAWLYLVWSVCVHIFNHKMVDNLCVLLTVYFVYHVSSFMLQYLSRKVYIFFVSLFWFIFLMCQHFFFLVLYQVWMARLWRHSVLFSVEKASGNPQSVLQGNWIYFQSVRDWTALNQKALEWVIQVKLLMPAVCKDV